MLRGITRTVHRTKWENKKTNLACAAEIFRLSSKKLSNRTIIFLLCLSGSKISATLSFSCDFSSSGTITSLHLFIQFKIGGGEKTKKNQEYKKKENAAALKPENNVTTKKRGKNKTK